MLWVNWPGSRVNAWRTGSSEFPTVSIVPLTLFVALALVMAQLIPPLVAEWGGYHQELPARGLAESGWPSRT